MNRNWQFDAINFIFASYENDLVQLVKLLSYIQTAIHLKYIYKKKSFVEFHNVIIYDTSLLSDPPQISYVMKT